MNTVSRDEELKVLKAATQLLQDMETGAAALGKSPDEIRETIAQAIRGVYSGSDDEKADSELRPLIPMLKEYTQKIQQILNGEIQYFNGKLTNERRTAIQTFAAPARKLAQFVSQRINRAKNDLLRMELELRLAEYESVLGLLTMPNLATILPQMVNA